jgi:hypothetical protein
VIFVSGHVREGVAESRLDRQTAAVVEIRLLVVKHEGAVGRQRKAEYGHRWAKFTRTKKRAIPVDFFGQIRT